MAWLSLQHKDYMAAFIIFFYKNCSNPHRHRSNYTIALDVGQNSSNMITKTEQDQARNIINTAHQSKEFIWKINAF